jgi:class 3 adenylate cyclase/tetratricopeptide (TPR) repeat protein
VSVVCPRCGEENPERARYCLNCGAPLEDASGLREERKLVSILFIDLVDFTARADRADPEDVRDSLQLYFARSKGLIEQYGGTVEKFIGDAVMAVFGAPVTYGDDAERAVRAGLRVLAAIEELNREHDLGLAARAAVNTGDAVVALGEHATGGSLALGDVVNTASRLQSAAPTGRLIVGEDTYRSTRHTIGYEAVGAVAAKGKAEPVAAWLASEPIAGPAERPIASHRLVGRGRELELMRSIWERALTEARPHRVTVLGPPGIGKSRLCREVSTLVEESGGRILRGRCLPYEESTGYEGFAHVVRARCEILEPDPSPRAREKLQHTVDHLLPEPEAAEICRHLALLLGLEADSGVLTRDLLFYAARRFVECLGREQPSLLVVEDVHWAADSELDLLEYLAAHVTDAAVAFVVAARPELLDTRPGWGSGMATQTTIVLEPLSSADAQALATSVLADLAEAAGPVDRLVAIAEGNPLFIEELAAAVAEQPDEEELPVTVRAAIASRIDSLPPESRSALLRAALIGKTFWRSLLRPLVESDGLDAALALLEQRGFVYREPASNLPGDAQYTFKHILIREVAYGTVPRAQRRELHATIASGIDALFVDPTDSHAWLLAHHWREAGEPVRAIPYLLAAADRATRGWAKESAAGLYGTALELAEDEETRRSIRLQQGLALVLLQEYEQATAALEELVPQLDEADRLEALLGQGRATLWLERDAEAVSLAEKALDLATSRNDDALPAATALVSQAYAIRGGEGDLDRAFELGERALELWRPGVRSEQLSEHFHLHADVAYWTGRYQRGTELAHAARELGGEVHSAEALLRGGGMEALSLTGLGRHEEALRVWDEMFELARELGRSPHVLLNYSSIAFRELYELQEARRRSEEALELAPATGFSMPRRFARSDLLLTHLLEGDVGRAQVEWPALWEDAQTATGWTRWLIYGRLAVARAEIALRVENAEAAVEWASKAVDITRSTRRAKYEVAARAILGEALGALGRHAEALSELTTAVTTADRLIGPPARWQARSALGRTLYAVGDDDGAARAFAEAADLIRGFAGTLAPARSDVLLGAEPVREVLAAASGSAR